MNSSHFQLMSTPPGLERPKVRSPFKRFSFFPTAHPAGCLQRSTLLTSTGYRLETESPCSLAHKILLKALVAHFHHPTCVILSWSTFQGVCGESGMCPLLQKLLLSPLLPTTQCQNTAKRHAQGGESSSQASSSAHTVLGPPGPCPASPEKCDLALGRGTRDDS